MRDGSPEPGSASAADSAATATFAGSQPPVGDLAEPMTHLPTEAAGPDSGLPDAAIADQAGLAPEPAGHDGLPAELVRYGPGVPATPPAGRAALTAEHVWRNTGAPGALGRLARLRRLSGWALTVILLAASGVLVYLRFHHAPFQVTRVAITQQTAPGCDVDVNGQIATNGSAGMVTYQWLFRPGSPPQPLTQSVVAGQHAVDVTVTVEGQGQGSASQTVTLQVLSPGQRMASAVVTVSCL
jgi:hypothetical protein